MAPGEVINHVASQQSATRLQQGTLTSPSTVRATASYSVRVVVARSCACATMSTNGTARCVIATTRGRECRQLCAWGGGADIGDTHLSCLLLSNRALLFPASHTRVFHHVHALGVKVCERRLHNGVLLIPHRQYLLQTWRGSRDNQHYSRSMALTPDSSSNKISSTTSEITSLFKRCVQHGHQQQLP
jgi:hypothetical protein